MPTKQYSRLINILFLLAWGLLSPSIFAGSTQQYGKFWTTILVTGSFENHDPWKYQLQQTTRFAHNKTLFKLAENIISIGYQATPYLSYWVGYIYIPFVPGDSSIVEAEHQLFEQFLLENNNYSVKHSFRTRLEERRREGVHEVLYRLREKIIFEFPEIPHYYYKPIISNEFFLNINDPSDYHHSRIDQNRFLVGIDIDLSRKMSMIVGYMNHYLFVNPTNICNHVLYLEMDIK